MGKNMLAGAVLAVALGLSAGQVRAGGVIDDNTIDFSKLTCDELMNEIRNDIKKGKSPEEAAGMNMMMAAMWIDGYLSHESGDTRTTLSWLGDVMTAIGDNCDKSPKTPLLKIVKSSLK